MSGLTNMKARIKFQGGANQQDRMISDKLKSLKKALIYSYQSATVGLFNPITSEYDREFRCLINPNKVNMEIDDKVISIPFEDVQLNAERAGTTTEGLVETGIKTGSVVHWKENNTYWLVYYQYLQERAYFRGMMRQCENDTLDINGVSHHYFLKGPDDQNLLWQKSSHFIFNDLNKNIEIYISKTREANEFFQRFTKLKIKGKSFKVEAVDRLSSEDILTVYLAEDFTDDWNDSAPSEPVAPIDPAEARIIGDYQVYPFDQKNYTVANLAGGSWRINNKQAVITTQSETSVDIDVVWGKSGEFELQYVIGGQIALTQPIEILSL